VPKNTNVTFYLLIFNVPQLPCRYIQLTGIGKHYLIFMQSACNALLLTVGCLWFQLVIEK